MNKRHWYWFKRYILKSALWSYKIDDKLLYKHLLDCVKEQNIVKENLLKAKIDAMDKDPPKGWTQMLKYPCSKIGEIIRQNGIIDENS